MMASALLDTEKRHSGTYVNVRSSRDPTAHSLAKSKAASALSAADDRIIQVDDEGVTWAGPESVGPLPYSSVVVEDRGIEGY